jgi:predicted glycosyltransferase
MKVWIDLDNSPHVPFFAPIIAELKNRGLSITLTARDAFQVCDLANLFHLKYKRVGRHFGKNRALKLGGTCLRALQLLPTALAERPHLALSHGSRAQLLLSALIHLPSAVIIDYEHAKGLGLMRPDWVMAPDVIPNGALGKDKRVLKYPGIKEDVYVPAFKPNSAIRPQLGLSESDLVVTLRPPATEAHYHNPESDELLKAVIDLLKARADARIVLLPRNKRQETVLREAWSDLFATRKIAIPDQAIDGLNLIWHSDLVISGGGTMNREAAALGVPVYSIFRGPIGAVDRYLASAGRLVLLENCEDVRTKIVLKRRDQRGEPKGKNSRALKKIVDNVVSILEQDCH